MEVAVACFPQVEKAVAARQMTARAIWHSADMSARIRALRQLEGVKAETKTTAGVDGHSVKG